RNPDCSDPMERARADEGYFRARMLESVERAGASADSLARLAYYELAGRYSLAALAAGGGRSPDRRGAH
ncbi:MAG TPA: hypothetical protein VF652_06825, partial [Allosphingosinicella sp.]